MDVEQTRQAFELHRVTFGDRIDYCLLPLSREPDGNYRYEDDRKAWIAWCAAINYYVNIPSEIISGDETQLASGISKQTSMYQIPRWPRITKDPHECKKCGAENEVSPTDFDDGEMLEADTKCTECGHIAFWRDGKYK